MSRKIANVNKNTKDNIYSYRKCYSANSENVGSVDSFFKADETLLAHLDVDSIEENHMQFETSKTKVKPTQWSTPVNNRLKRPLEIHCPDASNTIKTFCTSANHPPKLLQQPNNLSSVKRKQPVSGLPMKTYFSQDDATINDSEYNNLLDSLENTIPTACEGQNFKHATESETVSSPNTIPSSVVSSSYTYDINFLQRQIPNASAVQAKQSSSSAATKKSQLPIPNKVNCASPMVSQRSAMMKTSTPDKSSKSFTRCSAEKPFSSASAKTCAASSVTFTRTFAHHKQFSDGRVACSSNSTSSQRSENSFSSSSSSAANFPENKNYHGTTQTTGKSFVYSYATIKNLQNAAAKHSPHNANTAEKSANSTPASSSTNADSSTGATTISNSNTSKTMTSSSEDDETNSLSVQDAKRMMDVSISYEQISSGSLQSESEPQSLREKHFLKNNISLALSNAQAEFELFKRPLESAASADFIKSTPLQYALNDSTFTVSSQYAKEVDRLFDDIESKIVKLGTPRCGQTAQALESSATLTLSHPSSHTVNEIWENLKADESFASVIKRAVAENASKPVVRQGATTAAAPMMMNRTITEKAKVEFRSLGPFYDLPAQVQDLVKQFKGIDKLYEWQDECLKLNAIKTRKNLIYALPTSGGKTLVAEILMWREIMCRRKNVIFILPYVSIVQEKVWELSPFAIALDFLVEEYAAGRGLYPPRSRRRKQSIYVATIEKGLGLVNSLTELNRLDEIGLVVIDELHLVGEGGRGATLEGLLAKIMYLKEDIQVVGMSATIGNIHDVCKFLNSDIYTRNFRPVELTEYVKCGKEIARVDFTPKDRDETFVFDRKVDHLYTNAMEKLDPDHLGGLVMEVVPEGSCLIFCASKKNCENVAKLVCKLFSKEVYEHKQTERTHLRQALRTENGDVCPTLNHCLPYGVAYHHSGLTSDERRLIEDGFRNGILNVICCTSTLAAGVNLPAKRVIIRSPYVGRDFITLSRYKQMVGRAGRAGFGEKGESILVCNSQDIVKVRDLLLAPMDEAISQMTSEDNAGLRNLLLSSISMGIATNRLELRNVANCALLAIQQEKLKVDVKRLTDQVIADLFRKGALVAQTNHTLCNSDASLNFESNPGSQDYLSSSPASLLECTINSTFKSSKKHRKLTILNDTKLVISKLGTAAIKGGLSLGTAEILFNDLLKAQSSLVLLDCLHLLYLVTPYDLADTIKPDMTNFCFILETMGQKTQRTADVLGVNEICKRRMQLGQPIKHVSGKVLNRFYLTLTLYDLWNGETVYDVSEKYKISRGIVQQLMTVSAAFSLNVVHFCEEIDEFWMFADLIRGMSQRLQHCCTKELTPLMELPSVKQGRARQLFKAGYTNLQKVAKANPDDLMNQIDYMTRKVANELIATAKLVLLAKVATLREQAEDVLQGVDITNLNETVLPFKYACESTQNT